MLRCVFKTASDLRGEIYQLESDLTRSREENEIVQSKYKAAVEDLQVSRINEARAEAAVASLSMKATGLNEQEDDESDEEVEELLSEIEKHTGIPLTGAPQVGEDEHQASGSSLEGSEEIDADELFSDEESESTSSDRGSEYKPTPGAYASEYSTSGGGNTWASRSARKAGGRLQQKRENAQVLTLINDQRRARGENPVNRLTINLLEAELQQLRIPGWKRERKGKQQLINDYKRFAVSINPLSTSARSYFKLDGALGGLDHTQGDGLHTPKSYGDTVVANPTPRALEFMQNEKAARVKLENLKRPRYTFNTATDHDNNEIENGRHEGDILQYGWTRQGRGEEHSSGIPRHPGDRRLLHSISTPTHQP